jgi:hypothetical protein
MRQQTAHAVRAAQRHDDLRLRIGGGGVELRQAPGIGAAEAQVFFIVVVVVMDQEALLLKALHAQLQGRVIRRVTARRGNRDADFRCAQSASVYPSQ